MQRSNLRKIEHPAIGDGKLKSKVGDVAQAGTVEKLRRAPARRQMASAEPLRMFMEQFPKENFSAIGRELGLSGQAVSNYLSSDSMPVYMVLAIQQLTILKGGTLQAVPAPAKKVMIAMYGNEKGAVEKLTKVVNLMKTVQADFQQRYAVITGAPDDLVAFKDFMEDMSPLDIIEVTV